MSTIGLDSVLAGQTAVQTQSDSAASDPMGKDMFFKMLVAQLQYQDPLNPMENADFSSQLAQFSSLEKLSDISDNIGQLSAMQGSVNNIQSLSFIGKQVSAQGNMLNYTGEDININFDLASEASELCVHIYTEEGLPVRDITMSSLSAGDMEIPWNGKNNAGEQVNPGRYIFGIEAYDYNGLPVESTSNAMGTVTGLRYDNGTTYLIIDNKKEVTISDVDKILG